MATLPCKIKEEEQNFIKISFLNFKYSPILVRQFFDRTIPPNQLAPTINRNINRITGLIRTKRINAAQEDILRRIPGTVWPPPTSTLSISTPGTTSNDFDLTLMICLLRNIGGMSTPINGWDKLPNPNDKSDGAFLARLKFYRNKVAHPNEIPIPTQEFKDIWTAIEEALIHFNGGQAIAEVDDLFNRDFDSANTTILSELANLKQHYILCESEKVEAVQELAHYREGHLPKNIEDNMILLVESWKTDDEVFYETRGTEAVFNKIRSSHFVTVTGNSGSGKTAAIRHVALQFQEEGYQLISIESPDKIVEYRRNANQLFLVDDVVGKYDVDPSLLDSWERQNEKIQKCLTENGETKVLCSLRNQVALNKRFVNSNIILSKNVVNLDEQSLLLTHKEKRCIFLKYLNIKSEETEIDEEIITELCKTNHAFPLLCRLGTANAERLAGITNFFDKPFYVLKRELKELYTKNIEVYCSLVLCMLLNGSIPETVFHTDCQDEIFLKTLEACGLGQNVSKLIIFDSIQTVVGSYITYEENCFKFVHDALLESVSLVFSEESPTAMFTLCDFSVIRDRMTIHSDLNHKLEGETDVSIPVDEQHYEVVAKRMFTELKKGRFSDVLLSQIIKHTCFVKCLGQIIVSNERTSEEVLCYVNRYEVDNKLPYLVREIDAFSKFRQKIGKKKTTDAIKFVMYNSDKLLYWLVAFCCYDLFQYLWMDLPKQKQTRFLGRDCVFIYSKSLFSLAVLAGNLNIIKLLLNSGADINCFTIDGTTPLTIAIRSSKFELVSFLIENGANVNQFELLYNTSPCAVSVETGSADILKLLLEKHANPTLLNWNRKSPLSVAILKINHELTSLLLEHYYKMRGVHSDVSEQHNTDVSEQHNMNVSEQHNTDASEQHIKHSFGGTALHIAVIKNDTEFLRAFFDKSCSMTNVTDAQFNVENEEEVLIHFETKFAVPEINIADIHGFTPLHLSVIYDNTIITERFLSYGSDVNMRDNFGRNPMHYIKSTEMAKILIEHCHEKKCFKLSKRRQTERNLQTLSKFRFFLVNDIFANLFNFPLFQRSINMQDFAGNTPLHTITENYINETITDTETITEYDGITGVLMENGANLHITNNTGDFPTGTMHVKDQVKLLFRKLIFSLVLVLLFILPSIKINDYRMKNLNNISSNCTVISGNNSKETVYKLVSTNTKTAFGIVYFLFSLVSNIIKLRRFAPVRQYMSHMKRFFIICFLSEYVLMIMALLAVVSVFDCLRASAFPALIVIFYLLRSCTPTRVIYDDSNEQPLQKCIFVVIGLMFHLTFISIFYFVSFAKKQTPCIGDILNSNSIVANLGKCCINEFFLLFTDLGIAAIIFSLFMICLFLWFHCVDRLLKPVFF